MGALVQKGNLPGAPIEFFDAPRAFGAPSRKISQKEEMEWVLSVSSLEEGDLESTDDNHASEKATATLQEKPRSGAPKMLLEISETHHKESGAKQHKADSIGSILRRAARDSQLASI